jgi:hypothetical protein
LHGFGRSAGGKLWQVWLQVLANGPFLYPFSPGSGSFDR